MLEDQKFSINLDIVEIEELVSNINSLLTLYILFSVCVIGLNYGLCCRKKEGKECCLTELRDQRLTMRHVTRLGTIVGGPTIRVFFSVSGTRKFGWIMFGLIYW